MIFMLYIKLLGFNIAKVIKLFLKTNYCFFNPANSIYLQIHTALKNIVIYGK